MPEGPVKQDRVTAASRQGDAAQATPRNDGMVKAPQISLPKGGGAIRGMGEKFAANPVTGTGTMTVPIATSPGRSGFGPQLSLSYDSGSGNGSFGFGWNLALASITRKTDKGLPQYRDAEDSDVFILSGAEDLVAEYEKDDKGNWILKDGKHVIYENPRTVGTTTYTVRRYRPRIEGLFARIERWASHDDVNDVHWRSISKENILTIYGMDENSRVFDPADATHIFSWLICETIDDKGNAILYKYKKEDGTEVDLTQAHERNRGERNDPRRNANRYLKRILYGNRVPLLDDAGKRPIFLSTKERDDAGWMFEVVFDYDDHDPDSPHPKDDEAGQRDEPKYHWKVRHDPFSSYRAGFEIRTYRLCQRVLMFHHIPDISTTEKGYDGLVRSTDFTYSYESNEKDPRNPIYSFLKSVTQRGYKRQADGSYLTKPLPPLEFTYSEPLVQDLVEQVDAASLENLPIGLDGASYQWTDLHGEGIPGILSEQADAWFYKRNHSPINLKLHDGELRAEAKFAPVEVVAATPNRTLAGGQAQFMDLAGDGQPDLVTLDGPMPGLYEHDEEEGWRPFRPFTSYLNRDTGDPNLKFVDLDGDGHADVLITEDNAFVWHPSLGEEGFGPARRVAQALDEEKGPHLIFADGSQSIYLADLSGDGLTDLVRIRNGEVCYWPNFGYGRFGAKVTMDHSPQFDHPDQFDQKRIRLADMDGSGTTDIIYLHRDGVRLYFNQSGNAWSEPRVLNVFPRVDDLVSIVPIDLLGNGTACLVWSSPLSGYTSRQMQYVNLIGAHKPHLLVKTVNNLGAETEVSYAPSTKFYLADKLAGRPWITKLPLPVHVVERVKTEDRISHNRFVSRYAYHHGYFDAEEREFRGFGMVEQWDTEEFAALAGGNIPGDNIALESHVPPVHTKTWFHTGVYLGRERVSQQFEHEYFREPGLDIEAARPMLLADTTLPAVSTLDEERQASRALKGSMLRQEVYAHDAGPGASANQTQRARTPYTVTEQNFTIRPLQPRGANRHAVFLSHAHEATSYHYERNSVDPRIQHALTLEVDPYGNVVKQAAIGYGRRTTIRVVDAQGQVQQVPNPGLTELHATDQANQTTPLVTYSENRITNAIESSDTHRTPLPCEALTFELTDYTPTGAAGRFQSSDLVEPDPGAAGRLRHKFTDQVPYEAAATGNPCRRPIEWLRTLYRRDDLSGLLPLGELNSLDLPGESYKLAFTSGLLTQVFQRPRAGQPAEPLLPESAAVLGGQGGNRGGYLRSQTMKADGRFPATDADDHWWIPSGRSFFTTNPADPATTELAQAQQHFFLPRRYRDPFSQDAFVDFDANDLLMTETRDALGNRVTVNVNDYRVLQPRLVSDPNRNQTEVAFDALGMVVAIAVMGKPGENVGDLLEGFDPDPPLERVQGFVADPQAQAASFLGKATTRTLYDLDRYKRAGQPPLAATLARETHFHDPDGKQSRIQINFSYSDGFGRETQKKIKAEPGKASKRLPDVALPTGDTHPGDLVRDDKGKSVQAHTPRRWVGTGRTVFNNKGKPVKQYEPFFSATHLYEPEQELTDTGVSPVLFYDPVERVVATLHPNHTYEKIVFDPWQQMTYDVNDTTKASANPTVPPIDPKSDPDVGHYFRRLPDKAYLPTWYDLRMDGGKALLEWPDTDAQGQPMPQNAKRRAVEKSAAGKAALHAETPTTVYLDSMGRPFLTLTNNGPNPAQPGQHLLFAIRIHLDIEGNQREVIDAKGRIVMRCAYDMLGNRLRQSSMEAGERWKLDDVSGKPIRAWDSRGFNRRIAYDGLRRPTDVFVSEKDTERLAERTVYGEGQGEAHNHRTRVFQVFDGAGIVSSEEYDFKGNLRHSHRRLLLDYKAPADWTTDPARQVGEPFISRMAYDALNRPIITTSPDGSVYRATFNEANLLDKVDVNLRGAAVATSFVTNINYDAKGQRELIAYGNGATTTYKYDESTFRLMHLKTTRPAGLNGLASQLYVDPTIVQDLHYTYDPAGNITRIEDVALKTGVHNNEEIHPICSYRYDALYRLTEAKGREHIGQTGHDFNPPAGNRRDFQFLGLQAHSNDMQAMRNYTEHYDYDEAGNFDFISHTATNGNWTLSYDYTEKSLIEPGKQSNRLTKTTVGNGVNHTESYTYTDAQGNDVHGCMTAVSDTKMLWDFEDQLKQVDLKGGGTAYYVYDAAGQRVRKVWKKSATLVEERIYLGGFEIFRRHGGAIDADSVMLERETLHVMDDKQRIVLVETRTLDTVGNDQAPRQLIRYQFGNHLGSAALELDDRAEIISYEEYFPYGSTSYQAVRSQTETPKRYRYTSKERDEESGLYYHGARYYAAWLGRWTSCDPTGLTDGSNIYQYGHSNPLVFADPTGTTNIAQASANNVIYTRDPEMAERINRLSNNSFEQTDDGLPKGSQGGTLLAVHHPEMARMPDLIIMGGWNARNWYKTYFIMHEYGIANKDGTTTWYPAEIIDLGWVETSASLKDSLSALGDGLGFAGFITKAPTYVSKLALAGERALMSSKVGAPLTGIKRFDDLAVGTRQFEGWKAGVERRGLSVILDKTMQGAAGSISGKTLRINPDTFTYLDMLHESRHLEQIRLAANSGKNLKRGAYGAWAEIDAYRYEKRVLESYENARPGSKAFEAGDSRSYNRAYTDWYKENVLPKHNREYQTLTYAQKVFFDYFWKAK